MLRELRIAGLGVIEEAVLELGPGLTAVTGETGAGKTMIVTGLGLLLGGRAETGMIRTGHPRAVVEGRFSDLDDVADRVQDAGAELDDGELLVARHLSASGRSRALMGGAQVPVGVLAQVTGELATIHGQSEQLRLGTPERQREVLDRFGGPELGAVLGRYRAVFTERAGLIAERDQLRHSARERAREMDLLRFGLDEIGAVDPRPGEDAELAAEAARLQAVDDLRMLAERAHAALSGDDDEQPGAAALIGVARKSADQVAGLDPTASDLAQAVRELGYTVDDVAGRVAGYLADLEADPIRLEAITTRRAELSGLTRKYGADLTEVLAWARQAVARLLDLDGGDQRVEVLDELIAALDAEVAELAGRLSALRSAAASDLADRVRAELAALAMPQAQLSFGLRPLAEPGAHGAEQVLVQFSANPGAEPAPLARVASGGELSRVRLALEAVLAEDDRGTTFVFDEVDAGVGGRVALEVGRRLAALARHCQVIVVTHLPQVAAFADHHFVVAKADDGQVTVSGITEVTGEDRKAELARMMGAAAGSGVALDHAAELLQDARG